MFELLSTAVVELDAEGCVTTMNVSAENCFDMGRERVFGQLFQDLPGLPAALLQAINATSEDQRNRQIQECKLEGGWFDCNIQTTPAKGMLLEFYNLKWQRQQNKLQQREIQTGMMELLRRNLGHEIRNPLGGIRGAAQMMANELNGGELGTLAELIMREVDRVDELLKRFGQPELELGWVDIHRPLQETADLLNVESAETLKIKHDYDPSIPNLKADAAALRQLFLNLGRNALQAGATAMVFRSRIEHDSALLKPGVKYVVRIDLEDNGSGVREDLRGLLFMPMVTGRRDGTGLGLALAQQIAAAHDGLLTYEPMEQGSRFTLKLPMGNAHE
jgi:two-component system nitrogen regulation sensor histidine kinase GlnL